MTTHTTSRSIFFSIVATIALLVTGSMSSAQSINGPSSSKVDATSEVSTIAAGFAGGNRFEYTPAVGDVWVHCPRGGPGGAPGPSTASYRCYGYAFAPAEAAQFVGPQVNADFVELTAHRADGRIRTKSGAYNGLRGHSIDAFNLWIETVFQRALLNVGRNDIQWVLKNGGAEGQIVASGSFIAEVFQRPGMSCPSVSQTSWDPQDCVSSARVCSDYFYNFGNQCR